MGIGGGCVGSGGGGDDSGGGSKFLEGRAGWPAA